MDEALARVDRRSGVDAVGLGGLLLRELLPFWSTLSFPSWFDALSSTFFKLDLVLLLEVLEVMERVDFLLATDISLSILSFSSSFVITEALELVLVFLLVAERVNLRGGLLYFVSSSISLSFICKEFVVII